MLDVDFRHDAVTVDPEGSTSPTPWSPRSTATPDAWGATLARLDAAGRAGLSMLFSSLVWATPPPPPLSIAMVLEKADIVATAIPVRTQYDTIPPHTTVAIGCPWVEYRITRAFRGTDVGATLRLGGDPCWRNGVPPSLYRNTGREVVEVPRRGLPWRRRRSWLPVYLPHEPREVWLALTRREEQYYVVNTLPEVTEQNTPLIEAGLATPGTREAETYIWAAVPWPAPARPRSHP